MVADLSSRATQRAHPRAAASRTWWCPSRIRCDGLTTARIPPFPRRAVHAQRASHAHTLPRVTSRNSTRFEPSPARLGSIEPSGVLRGVTLGSDAHRSRCFAVIEPRFHEGACSGNCGWSKTAGPPPSIARSCQTQISLRARFRSLEAKLASHGFRRTIIHLLSTTQSFLAPGPVPIGGLSAPFARRKCSRPPGALPPGMPSSDVAGVPTFCPCPCPCPSPSPLACAWTATQSWSPG